MNLEIGSTIGDYQVVGILGTGGMGKVYKVRNVISDRLEAMKVLLPDLAHQPELADRFLREIKVQASRDHPNIASMHPALRVDNQLLMLMEAVEGVSLDQKLKDGPRPAAAPAGTAVGSLYYMSPEQIQGVTAPDARSDLCSVGVSLCELVTGKRPFDGESQFAIMSAHLLGTPVPPITVDPRLPKMLNDVILMAVAKDANARFQTAAA